MPSNIQRLRVALEEWLIRNELDGDICFFEPTDWRIREEDFLNDADLILVFEGGLHTMLNYGGDAEEFEDYVESFGYYYEKGNHWNLGFYPIDGYDFRPVFGSYMDKLKDSRWVAKSKRVKELAGWKCQDCGGPPPLESHHCYYTTMREGNYPWEYPLSAIRCLCRSCHVVRAKSESRMRAYFARLTTKQIDALKEGLDGSFYWFKADAVIRLLSKIGHSDEDIIAAVHELMENRNKDA